MKKGDKVRANNGPKGGLSGVIEQVRGALALVKWRDGSTGWISTFYLDKVEGRG